MLTKVAKYGIATRHILMFIPVSRVTASGWINGRVSPCKYLQADAAQLAAAISTAVKHRELPAPKNITGRTLDAYIRAVLAKYYKGSGASARPA